MYDNMAEQGSHGGAGGAAVLDDAVDRAPFHDASGGGAAAGEGVGGVRRGAGGVLLVRVKRRRGEDPSDCITMRVKKRVDTKDETHGIQLRRVEFDPGNPGAVIKPPKNRSDRRGRLVHKTTYDPRPSNPHRRGDLRQEIKEGQSKARLVRFREARSMGVAPGASQHEQQGESGAGAASGGLGAADAARKGDASAVDESAGKAGETISSAGSAAASSDEIRILDIVDLVAESRAKHAKSKYSDITCNDTQLERILMRLQIDEKTGFTKRGEPKVETKLRMGRGRPGRGVDSDEGDDEDNMGDSSIDEDVDLYDLYIMPEHESLPDPTAEYWIEAGDDEFVDEEEEVTDDSDDPDAKEVDYDDEYAESADDDDGDVDEFGGGLPRRYFRGGARDDDDGYGYGYGDDGDEDGEDDDGDLDYGY